jgi:hypothetical protein
MRRRHVYWNFIKSVGQQADQFDMMTPAKVAQMFMRLLLLMLWLSFTADTYFADNSECEEYTPPGIGSTADRDNCLGTRYLYLSSVSFFFLFSFFACTARVFNIRAQL